MSALKKLTLITTLTFLPLITLAAGLSVSPARLNFAIDGGKPTSQNIIVANPTADVILFEVYPDEFSDVLRPNPASFTLEAGGRQAVTILIDTTHLKQYQLISTNLSVVGKPLAENKVSIGAGAKIPITITVNPPNAKKPHAQSGLIILGILLILGLLKKRGQANHSVNSS